MPAAQLPRKVPVEAQCQLFRQVQLKAVLHGHVIHHEEELAIVARIKTHILPAHRASEVHRLVWPDPASSLRSEPTFQGSSLLGISTALLVNIQGTLFKHLCG